MRSLSFLVLPFLALTVAAAPAQSGAAFATDYAIRDFSGIALGTGSQVEVRVGPTGSVHASGPGAVLATMRVVRDGNMLKIERRDRRAKGDPALERQVRFTVTTPALSSAALGGTGAMRIDRVAGPHFTASVGGQGSIAIAALTSDEAEIAVGGTGSVAAGGRVRALKVSIGGAGTLRAPALHAAHAEVSIAGSGSVVALVDGDARVSSVGSGTIDLGPRARCDVSKMGSARIRCGA